MVKIWVRKKPEQFAAGEWCPICGHTAFNDTPFPFLMCMGRDGNSHKPIAMIRVHQKKGYFPAPKRRRLIR